MEEIIALCLFFILFFIGPLSIPFIIIYVSKRQQAEVERNRRRIEKEKSFRKSQKGLHTKQSSFTKKNRPRAYSHVRRVFVGPNVVREANASCNRLKRKYDSVIDTLDQMTSAPTIIDPTVYIPVAENAAQLLDEYEPLFLDKKLRYSSRINDLSLSAYKAQYKAAEFVEKMKEHNDRLWSMKIDKAKELIKDVEGYPLDNQQMLSVVKDVKNHLILAGAGTGKSTTIIGKVKYMLATKQCQPEDLLILSFTNAAASEMKERLTKETGQTVDVSTFHKLGLNIIQSVDGVVPKITHLNMRDFVKNKIKELMISNPDYMYDVGQYLLYQRHNIKNEFEFHTKEEYDDFLRWNPPTTIQGEVVKSYGEMEIANFLHECGIKYIYEHPYEHDTNDKEHSQYHPDFYLPDYKIYIEYYGIDRNNKVPDWFGSVGSDASEEYLQSMKWKDDIHAQYNTKLIKLFAYEHLEGILLDRLESQLKESDVILNPLSNTETWMRLKNDEEGVTLDPLVELVESVINLMKSNRYTVDDLIALNNEPSLNRRSNARTIRIVSPIFDLYQKYLDYNNEIDFNDMINKAIDYVKDGKYIHNYSMVIVDEYQDISKSRFNLLKSMRDSRDYSLFCVGDDWQSIYRFAGSDIDFILRFDYYWGPTEMSKIETTYRFSQSLIDVSGDFIMSNPQQVKKSLVGKSPRAGFCVGEIDSYGEKSACTLIGYRLEDLPKNSTVYFIGRYNFDIKMFDGHEDFAYRYNNVSGFVDVRYRHRTDLKIEFLSAHKSKGLQADYVFIINNKTGKTGFPSQIQDAAILSLLLNDCDSHPFAEERRLYYVAMTRARVKTFFVTIRSKESIFAKELKTKYPKQLKQEKFTCPLCGGRLEKKTGPYSQFFGCENYRTAGCRYIRKIRKHEE